MYLVCCPSTGFYVERRSLTRWGIQKSAADTSFSQMYNLILLITNMRPEVVVAEKTELNEN